MMVRFLKSDEIYEILENLLKSVKSQEISDTKVKSKFIHPFWGVGDPSTNTMHHSLIRQIIVHNLDVHH